MKKLLLPIAALVLAVVPVLQMATPAMADVLPLKLYAGIGRHLAGNVEVWNDADNLYVKYHTWNGWELRRTHLAVGGSIEDIPQTRWGRPRVLRFDYSSAHGPGERTVVHTIPLAGLPDTVVIAAHAVVYNPDLPGWIKIRNAWPYDKCISIKFPGDRLASCFPYTIQQD